MLHLVAAITVVGFIEHNELNMHGFSMDNAMNDFTDFRQQQHQQLKCSRALV